MFHKTQNLVARVGVVLGAVLVLGAAGTQFLQSRTDSIGLLVVAQGAIAAAIFLSSVLAHSGDRETLSVYKEMRHRA